MSKPTPPTHTGSSATAQLEAILDSAVDAIISIDQNGIITRVNPAAAQLFGYSREEFLGQNVRFLMPEPYRKEHDGYLRAYRETGRRKIIGIGREVTGRRSDGTLFPMHLAVSEYQIDGRTHFTGIIHNLTAQREAETALQQAQKMDAMGQLTGGIAHDFNNLLTVIMGNLELLEPRLQTDAERELVGEAIEAAEVGSRLTSRLLAFARRSLLEPEVVNLNAFVMNLTDMLHRTLGETIYLSNTLHPELWLVRADSSQVESAIVNLAVNARDAMMDGGRLIIETRNAEVDTDYADAVEGLIPGEYVRLSVTDTGVGMPDDVKARAFEPFFTTKDIGRGTGLGLSMIYGFARQSGGHAAIYSEPGKGTTVSIYLPRFVPDGEGVSETTNDRTIKGQNEMILVVEDDARLRRLTVTRLKALGYSVCEAATGQEALDVLGSGEKVALLFTDLVMPGGMSGLDLSERARSLYPDIKLLLTSGYSEELVNAETTANTIPLLRKPYRQADLARAVDGALRR